MQGEGLKGSESLERKKNEGRGRKKKNSEAEALPNCEDMCMKVLMMPRQKQHKFYFKS